MVPATLSTLSPVAPACPQAGRTLVLQNINQPFAKVSIAPKFFFKQHKKFAE